MELEVCAPLLPSAAHSLLAVVIPVMYRNTDPVDSLASFPGRSHRQYLIAYSMLIQRGKAWEI